MRNKITYEWTLEIMQDGDIVDSNFSDNLTFDKADLAGNELAIVMNEGNEIDGVTGRLWAYVKDGKLPDCFSNANGQPLTGYPVSKRYHDELNKYLNQ